MFINLDDVSASGKLILLAGVIAILIASWIIATAVIAYPTRKEKGALKKFNKRSKVSTEIQFTSIDDALIGVAKSISKYIKLTPIARSDMARKLQISRTNLTPEEFQAYLIVKGFFLGIPGVAIAAVGGIMGSLLLVIIGIGLALIGVIYAVIRNRSLTTAYVRVMRAIEKDLPPFVTYMYYMLNMKKGESILSILEDYRPPEDSLFEKEYEFTIADAKASDLRGALMRFEQRIQSEKLTQVIRGLISANSGSDMTDYFFRLKELFSQYEKSLLKKEIDDIPGKMAIPKILLYLTIILAMVYPVAMQIIEVFKEVVGYL